VSFLSSSINIFLILLSLYIFLRFSAIFFYDNILTKLFVKFNTKITAAKIILKFIAGCARIISFNKAGENYERTYSRPGPRSRGIDSRDIIRRGIPAGLP